MSTTDLQFRQDLLQIRLPAVKTTTLFRQSTAAIADHRQIEEDSSITTASVTAAAAAGEDDECSTPTSAEHIIPTLFSCPPAPKKQRYQPACSCKRKLACEFQFYEIVARDEIEEFFRSGFEAVDRNSKRRR